MLGLGAVYVVATLFCSQQLVFAAVQANVNQGLNNLPPLERREREGSITGRALLAGLALALVVYSARSLIESGARPTVVLGTALVAMGVTLVFCLTASELGAREGRRRDPRPAHRLQTAMLWVEEAICLWWQALFTGSVPDLASAGPVGNGGPGHGRGKGGACVS